MRVTILPPDKPHIVLDLTEDEARMLRAVLARQLGAGPSWLDTFARLLNNALSVAGVGPAETAL